MERPRCCRYQGLAFQRILFRSPNYHRKPLAQEYLQCSLVLVLFPEHDIDLSDLELVLVRGMTRL